MTFGKYKRIVQTARRSPHYWSRVAVRDFVEELSARMVQQGISRAALAQGAEVSPAYITKVLRGSENLTVETMAKLALAAGAKVRVHVAPLEAETRWVDDLTNEMSTTASACNALAEKKKNVKSGAG